MNFLRGNFVTQLRNYFSSQTSHEAVEKIGEEKEKAKLE